MSRSWTSEFGRFRLSRSWKLFVGGPGAVNRTVAFANLFVPFQVAGKWMGYSTIRIRLNTLGKRTLRRASSIQMSTLHRFDPAGAGPTLTRRGSTRLARHKYVGKPRMLRPAVTGPVISEITSTTVTVSGTINPQGHRAASSRAGIAARSSTSSPGHAR